MQGKITKKQKAVYDYICQYIDLNDYSPTQKEIQEHFGFKSLGSVQDYIKYLVTSGYLKNDPNSVRALEPIRDENEVFEKSIDIPLLGKVAAGIPIEVIEHTDMIAVPQHMIRNGNYFALTVQGQSMIDDGILDGDIIIVKEQKTAQNGDTVIANIDNEATVKRFYKTKNSIELHPANTQMKPILVDPEQPFEIKGILAGLLRFY
jgi:repressor LexA